MRNFKLLLIGLPMLMLVWTGAYGAAGGAPGGGGGISGSVTGSYVFANSQFVVVNGTNVFFKSGGSLTNPVASGGSWTNPIISQGTLTNMARADVTGTVAAVTFQIGSNLVTVVRQIVGNGFQVLVGTNLVTVTTNAVDGGLNYDDLAMIGKFSGNGGVWLGSAAINAQAMTNAALWQAGGITTVQSLYGQQIYFDAGGSHLWTMVNSNLVPGADNLMDFGSGVIRVRGIYGMTNFIGGTSNYIYTGPSNTLFVVVGTNTVTIQTNGIITGFKFAGDGSLLTGIAGGGGNGLPGNANQILTNSSTISIKDGVQLTNALVRSTFAQASASETNTWTMFSTSWSVASMDGTTWDNYDSSTRTRIINGFVQLTNLAVTGPIVGGAISGSSLTTGAGSTNGAPITQTGTNGLNMVTRIDPAIPEGTTNTIGPQFFASATNAMLDFNKGSFMVQTNFTRTNTICLFTNLAPWRTVSLAIPGTTNGGPTYTTRFDVPAGWVISWPTNQLAQIGSGNVVTGAPNNSLQFVFSSRRQDGTNVLNAVLGRNQY